MPIKSYRELIVWQKSVELALLIYSIVKDIPLRNGFALGEQMRRSSLSIPSNIAEGKGRKTRKEFLRFLRIAYGSACELETQIIILGETTNITQQTKVMGLTIEIKKMLNALSKKLSQNSSPSH